MCSSSCCHLQGPSEQTGIVRSADGNAETQTFPAGSSSIMFNFALTDDNIGLEAVESYVASLQLVGSPVGVELGTTIETTVVVEDDDGRLHTISTSKTLLGGFLVVYSIEVHSVLYL